MPIQCIRVSRSSPSAALTSATTTGTQPMISDAFATDVRASPFMKSSW